MGLVVSLVCIGIYTKQFVLLYFNIYPLERVGGSLVSAALVQY